MVQSYTRLELGSTFGIVSSNTNVVHVAGSSAGRAIVGAAEAVQVWNLKKSELVNRFVEPALQQGRVQVQKLAYEPISSLIAAGYSDGSIRVWDMHSGACLITFNGHKSGISALAFDQSGTRLISGSFDTNIVVWDLVEETGLYRLRGHRGPITAVVLLSDQWLVSTAKDGVLKLWDLETQFSVESHVAHKSECWGAVASTDGTRLFTVSNTTEINVWKIDLEDQTNRRISLEGTLEKQSKHRAVDVKYSNDQLIVATADAVQSWRLRSAEEQKKALRRKEKRAKKKETTEDEKEVVLSMSDIYVSTGIVRPKGKVCGIDTVDKPDQIVVNLANNSIETWPLTENPERIFAIELPGSRTDVRDVCLSADNKLLAAGSNGQIKVFNARTNSCLRTLTGTGYILALRFLPGDALVVAGTKEGNLELYDITTSSLVGTFPAHEGSVWSMDIATDGKSLVTGGADKTVKFWDFRVVQEEVPGHEGVTVPKMTLKNTHKIEFSDDVLAVKLSPDGKLVAASLLDNTIKVYYRDTLKFFLNLYGHQLPVLSLDISHDSKLLISSAADKNIKIWGLDFGDCHKSIFAHEDSVLRVMFEPQTHYFFSCGKDGLVKYWDGRKFIQIQKLQAHFGEVWALAIANDGSFVVSASHDKTIRMWEMTDEPLFIEEERENELEEQYEENLVESLDRDLQDQDGDEAEGTEAVSKHTIDSLKAGERLFEALDICITDLETKPNPRHVILATLDVAPERYLMDVLQKIKPALVEDALLTFPLDKVTGLFKFINIWIEKKWNLPLITRVLLFCLRNFHRQIVANRMMEPEMQELKIALRAALTNVTDMLGFNFAQLKYIQDMWDTDHIKGFEDDKSTNGSGVKRVFPTAGL